MKHTKAKSYYTYECTDLKEAMARMPRSQIEQTVNAPLLATAYSKARNKYINKWKKNLAIKLKALKRAANTKHNHMDF